jgi:hypothetical protein
MQIAVRSTYMAGVALIGAGVIAVSPVAPPMPDIHLPAVHASAVQLAALSQANPLTQWGQVIAEALQNTKVLATGVLADPAPVLGQIVKNQFASAATFGGSLKDFLTAVVAQLGQTPEMVKQALGQLAAGQITDGLVTLFQAAIFPIIVPVLNTNFLTDVQAVVRKPVQNMLNVIDAALFTPTGAGWVLAAGFPAIQLMGDAVTATGDSLQRVLNAVKAGNLGAALGAILAIPATITGALLNGYQGDGGGILGPNGIVQGLRNALHIIATAITPATTEAVAAASIPQKSTGITLSMGDKLATVAKPVAAVPATGAKNTSADQNAEKPAAAADANDDSATAPVAKTDRRARGPHQKSSSGAADASATAAGQQTTGAGDDASAPTPKAATRSKGDRTGVKNGNNAAAGSRGIHHTHHAAKGGAE